jgi:hypothetical protein
MKVFQFAANLEAQIRQEVEVVMAQSPPELQAVVTAVGAFQAGIELLVDRAQYVDVDSGRYPEVNAAALLGPDGVWQEATASLGDWRESTVVGLASLWFLIVLTEKSGQYYQQAALNSAHPATRLFFSSLAEVKGMLRRRLDGLLRQLYNAAWTQVGFAPFVLGKD